MLSPLPILDDLEDLDGKSIVRTMNIDDKLYLILKEGEDQQLSGFLPDTAYLSMILVHEEAKREAEAKAKATAIRNVRSLIAAQGLTEEDLCIKS